MDMIHLRTVGSNNFRKKPHHLANIMSVNPCSCSCVILSHDPAVVTSLGYLLRVVLQCECQIVVEADDAFLDVEPYIAAAPDVLFLYADASNQSALSQVPVPRSKGLETLVITVLKDLPDLGAQMYEAGAADVVHWPADLKEVALRLRHHLGDRWDSTKTINLETDWEAESYVAGAADLTTAEAQIVRILMAKDGRIVTRDELSMTLDARPWRHGDRKYDVHMAKIRKKLLAAFGSNLTVSTIRSRGYRLSTNGKNLFSSAQH